MASSTPLIRKWRRWLKRIEQEQLQDLLINQHFFNEFRAHYASHGHGADHAELAEWIVQAHIAFIATAIRRIMEKPNRSWNSISLRILLEDMAKNDTELTRERYLAMYRGASRERFGNRDFDQIVRRSGAKKMAAHRINRDLKELDHICMSVFRLVNKVIAHTEQDRRKIGKTKYGDFDKAIGKIVVTFQRYDLLINGKTGESLVPLDEYDISDSLNVLWPRS
jgi:hypothetical protein